MTNANNNELYMKAKIFSSRCHSCPSFMYSLWASPRVNSGTDSIYLSFYNHFLCLTKCFLNKKSYFHLNAQGFSFEVSVQSVPLRL